MKISRGQASTEYLVILGAVLMIGLVAVGTMTVIPSLNQVAKERQMGQYWAQATPFSISFSRLDAGNYSLSVANNAKKTLVLTEIELGVDSQVARFWVPVGSQSFRPGQEIVLSNGTFGIGSNPCYGEPAGTYYEFKNVTLIYTEGSIPDIRQTGLGLTGSCAG